METTEQHEKQISKYTTYKPIWQISNSFKSSLFTYLQVGTSYHCLNGKSFDIFAEVFAFQACELTRRTNHLSTTLIYNNYCKQIFQTLL